MPRAQNLGSTYSDLCPSLLTCLALILMLVWNQAQPVTCFSKTECVGSNTVPVLSLSLIKHGGYCFCALENFELPCKSLHCVIAENSRKDKVESPQRMGEALRPQSKDAHLCQLPSTAQLPTDLPAECDHRSEFWEEQLSPAHKLYSWANKMVIVLSQ